MSPLRSIVLVLFLPAALGGCFLFGGGEEEQKKEQQGAYMEGSPGSGPAATTGALEDPSTASGPSNALPVASLIVSGITMLLLIIHMSRHRPRADSGC